MFVGKPRVVKENGGKRVLIEIDVLSTKKPTVVWSKDGQNIKDEGRYIIDIFETQPNMFILVLEIDSVTPQDGGKYKCSVGNQKGDASTQVDLQLDGEEKKDEKKDEKKEEKKPEEKKPEEKKEEKKPEEKKAEAKKPEEAKPAEEKKAEPAKRDSKAEAPKPEEKKAEPAKRDSKVEPAKKDSKATEVPAQFKDKPKDQVGVDGDRITIMCKVIGSPKPEITWFNSKKQAIKKSKVITNHLN